VALGRRLDLHVHLAGVQGDGCGCFVSDRMRQTMTFRVLMRLMGADMRAPAGANAAYVTRLADLLATSEELDYACLFAMDGVYDAQGDLVPADSHLFVPNSYVFAACRRSPHLLPVISINPQRRDALEELERWGDLAVALKWLAPMQKFDPSQARYEAFYHKLAALELPVIAHTGCEHTFPGMEQRLGNPLLYERLIRHGVPVIFSHCGTGSFLHPGHDYSEQFVAMLERYDHVYGDTSAFCSLVRYKQVRRFAADRYAGRILHGSDFPIPSSALYFLPALGFGKVLKLEQARHGLDRDVKIKKAMGMPDSVFEGAYGLLEKRITRWEARRVIQGG
jgi:predicted TIM-barrel fold metal-dependent hydrolase